MKPKKSLGQNFLTSGKAVFEIVKAGDLTKDDLVLEIGPGKGALTEEILKSGAKVLAIEKDDELVIFLKEKFAKEIASHQLEILNQDVMEFKIQNHPIFNSTPSVSASQLPQGKQNPKYKLIANIPYYITGAIIEKFLSEEIKPELMVLLVQKEVAERIVAKDGKESILSLAVKYYCDESNPPKIVYRVSAGSFFPKPKVDSAVLRITLSNPAAKAAHLKREGANPKIIEEKYFEIVKKAFAHKRKMMLGNLKSADQNTTPSGFQPASHGEAITSDAQQQDPSLGKVPKAEGVDWVKIFDDLKLNKKVRAEDLKKGDFLRIVSEVLK